MYSTIDLKNLFVAPKVLFRYWGLVITKLILLESVLPFQWITQEKLIFHINLVSKSNAQQLKLIFYIYFNAATRIVFIRNPLHADSESLSKDIVTVLVEEYECFTAELADTYLSCKISSGLRSAPTLERMWKIYRKLRDEFYDCQMLILQIGSPAHTLRSFDSDSISMSFAGKIFPTFQDRLAQFPKKRTELLGIRVGVSIESLKSIPKTTTSGSCFIQFTAKCEQHTQLLVAALRQMKVDESAFDFSGINLDNFHESTCSFSQILQRFDSWRISNALDNQEEISTEHQLLCKEGAEQDIHIILGSFRARDTPSSFILNPCFPIGCLHNYAMDDYFSLVNGSKIFGAILKATYLTVILGLTAKSPREILNMVRDDTKYPALQVFVQHFEDHHLKPVGNKCYLCDLCLFIFCSGLVIDLLQLFESFNLRNLFFICTHSATTEMKAPSQYQHLPTQKPHQMWYGRENSIFVMKNCPRRAKKIRLKMDKSVLYVLAQCTLPRLVMYAAEYISTSIVSAQNASPIQGMVIK